MEPQSKPKYTQEQIIQAMRIYYQKHGTLPKGMEQYRKHLNIPDPLTQIQNQRKAMEELGKIRDMQVEDRIVSGQGTAADSAYAKKTGMRVFGDEEKPDKKKPKSKLDLLKEKRMTKEEQRKLFEINTEERILSGRGTAADSAYAKKTGMKVFGDEENPGKSAQQRTYAAAVDRYSSQSIEALNNIKRMAGMPSQGEFGQPLGLNLETVQDYLNDHPDLLKNPMVKNELTRAKMYADSGRILNNFIEMHGGDNPEGAIKLWDNFMLLTNTLGGDKDAAIKALAQNFGYDADALKRVFYTAINRK